MQSDSTVQRRKRRVGRPSALTPDVETMILNAVRCGSSYRSACVAAGVGERSFHRLPVRLLADLKIIVPQRDPA